MNDIFNNEEISVYITNKNENLGCIGFTEHSFACAKWSAKYAVYLADILIFFNNCAIVFVVVTISYLLLLNVLY